MDILVAAVDILAAVVDILVAVAGSLVVADILVVAGIQVVEVLEGTPVAVVDSLVAVEQVDNPEGGKATAEDADPDPEEHRAEAQPTRFLPLAVGRRVVRHLRRRQD